MGAAITKFGHEKMLHLVWACINKEGYHGNHRELMQLTLPEEPSMQQEIKGKKSEGLMVGADCKDNVNGCKRGLKCRKLGDEVHESWKCTPKPKNALTSGGPLSKENALTSGGPLSFVLGAPRKFLNLVLGAPGRLLDFFLSSMKIIWTTIWTTLFATVPTVTATAVEEAANAVEEAATAVAATAVEEVEYEDGPSMDEKTEKVKKVENVVMKVGESEDNNRLAKNLPPTSEPKRFINLYGNKV